MAAVALAVAVPARAVPVDNAVDLVVGDEHFLRLAGVVAAEIDSPAVVTAELLPSGEILLTAKAPGRTLLFLASEERTAAWRLRVRERGGRFEEAEATPEARAAASKACPGLKEETSARGLGVVVTVPNPACRAALMRLVSADPYRAGAMEITFTAESLRDQLVAIEQRAAAAGLTGLAFAYRGATLVVKGSAPAGSRLKLARLLYVTALGRVPAEFRFEEAGPPDAGSAAPGGARP